MNSKKQFAAASFTLIILLSFCGCAPEAERPVKPVPDQEDTYKAVNMFRKEYLFDQPSSKKKTEKTTEVTVEVIYDQTITGIDREQNTTADITIKALKYHSSNAGQVQIDFDSSRGTDTDNALAKLVGQTYTIKTSPTGQVIEISNLESALNAVKTGPDAKFAARLLDDDNIKRRHEILALPDQNKKKLKAGDKWSRITPSPPGVLIQKTFEKIYTVSKITKSDAGELALVEMNATPTSKTSDSSKDTDAIDTFGKLFDTDDSYTGQLLINIETGKVHSYREKFASQYTAAEFPKGSQQADGQPDVLQLAFTEEHSIEAID